MKRIIIVLVTLLMLCLTGCAEKRPESPFGVTFVKNEDSWTTTFTRLPFDSQDLEVIDWSNKYEVAALLPAVLMVYNENADRCFEMLDVLMGPENHSSYDENFIKEQLKQYPYVLNSYIDGTNPQTDYDYEKISITVYEHAYSYAEDGYVSLNFVSSGADSARSVKFRHKASSDEWFLFSDSYKGLLAGIRIPAKDDKWN